jgi:hypothetical protein
MNIRTSTITSVVALTLSGALLGCSNSSDNSSDASNGPVAASCPVAAAQALQACIDVVSSAVGACYLNGDAGCADNNADILAAQDTLQTAVADSCADGEFMGLSVDATVGRLQNACQSQPDAIAWRTFGGPQAAVWPSASQEQRDCLQTAHATVSQFFGDSLVAINTCLADDDCDTAALTSAQRDAAATAATDIAAACPALSDIIAVTPTEYVALAQDQIDCTVATVHADTGALALGCGPSNVDVVPARGEWTQVILDGDKWGTMCGDGTEYAVQIRLAPEGYPLDRVMVALQGGGVCLFEADCRSRIESSPNLLNAQGADDVALGSGIASDSTDNPFANWTKIYLPYCNQDVFMGGGVVENLSDDLALPRYGAVNMRAGVRVLRDILWKEMDAAGGAGFRPDELVALFGGFSAGAYGVIYNYHWMLDYLQWPRTAAFPDAGGALDNGELAGVRALGPLKIPAWGARPHLPSYCFQGDCAVGTVIYNTMSPRLKQVPEQQFLILSNQRDDTQQRDAFFTDRAHWIDTMRSAYCDTKDLPGIQWYLTSESLTSVHVVSIRDNLFYGEVAGERMVDWLWRTVTDPDSISDWAEEANFTTDIPGSHPFPCALP